MQRNARSTGRFRKPIENAITLAIAAGLIVAAMIIAVSCNTPNEKAPTGSDQWTAPEGVYPHDEQFSHVEGHGKYVLENEAEACKECHGEKLKGGWSEISCRQCHTSYPHFEEFARPKYHGARAVEGGNDRLRVNVRHNCATNCHGSDSIHGEGRNYMGGDSGMSCFMCHANYPHQLNWDKIKNHGVFTLNNGGPDNCASKCHGKDLAGGNYGPSCTSCHAVYPHNWDPFSEHGLKAVEVGLDSCSTQCHGYDYNGGVSGVACNDCHAF